MHNVQNKRITVNKYLRKFSNFNSCPSFVVGTPAKSSMAEVLVSVTDINDDNPERAGVPSNKYPLCWYPVVIIVYVVFTTGL